jgi:hypothetical protein
MFAIVLVVTVINGASAIVSTTEQRVRTVESKAECERLTKPYDMTKQWLADGSLIATSLKCEPV